MQSNIISDLEILQRFKKEYNGMVIALLSGAKSYEDTLYKGRLEFRNTSTGFIHAALNKLGFNVILVNNAVSVSQMVSELEQAQVVFLNMHGEYGEDGSIQGLLKYINKPYIGSDIYPNALGSDKVLFKDLLISLGYPTPNYLALAKSQPLDLTKLKNEIDFPAMLKIINGGSSLGVYFVESIEGLTRTFAVARQDYQDRAFFIEKFISGRDLVISILDLPRQTLILPILEIICQGRIYSKEGKYPDPNKQPIARYDIPAKIQLDIQQTLIKIALNIYKKVGCQGFARLDLKLTADNYFYFLEINTLPSLRQYGNFMSCAVAGELDIELILLALLYNALNKK